jgi:hypothetical protein
MADVVLSTTAEMLAFLGYTPSLEVAQQVFRRLESAGLSVRRIQANVWRLGERGFLTPDVVNVYNQARVNLFAAEVRAYVATGVALRQMGRSAEADSIPVPLLLPAWTGAVRSGPPGPVTVEISAPSIAGAGVSGMHGLRDMRPIRTRVGNLGILPIFGASVFGSSLLVLAAAAWILNNYLTQDVQIAATIAERYGTTYDNVIEQRRIYAEHCWQQSNAGIRDACIAQITTLFPVPPPPGVWSWRPPASPNLDSVFAPTGWVIAAAVIGVGGYVGYRVIKAKFFTP